MKKIIIFLSVLCLMVSLFTITTFAEDLTISAGEYTFSPSTLTTPPFNEGTQVDFLFSCSDGKYYSGFSYALEKLYFIDADYNGSVVQVYNFSKNTVGSGFTNADEYTITLTEPASVDSVFFYWFEDNFKKGVSAFCDGSTCPAIDLNRDNVCDDCGSVLVMSLRSPLLEYVYTTIDFVMENTFPDYDYWFISSSGDYYRIELSKEPFYYDSTTGALRASSDVQSARVFENDNGSFGNGGWQHYSGPFTYTPLPNIVDSSHEINFPETPLWEEIQGVAEGQIQNKTLPRLGGTMMTLVICGISLVALVVLLVLLSKKLRIFLR